MSQKFKEAQKPSVAGVTLGESERRRQGETPAGPQSDAAEVVMPD
jgi:hypothetical protein